MLVMSPNLFPSSTLHEPWIPRMCATGTRGAQTQKATVSILIFHLHIPITCSFIAHSNYMFRRGSACLSQDLAVRETTSIRLAFKGKCR